MNNTKNSCPFLRRAIDLANLADREIKSNPPVGCVIVRDGKIIGEGRHEKFGEAHAEVNAYNDAVKNGFQPDENCEVYVTLEPCGHYGKTPPCAELISTFKPKAVHILEHDRHPVTSGKGLKILEDNGIKYEFYEVKGQPTLLSRFYKNNLKKQPWIILKYAQTADHFMASTQGQIQISDPYTARLTHKWRSLCDGILIGKNTLETDDPELNNRHWTGPSPIRFVVGNNFSKPLNSYKLFQGENPGILITSNKQLSESSNCIYLPQIKWDLVWSILYEKYGINSLLVEGGSQILQSIIDENAWDEARVITSNKVNEKADIAAPQLFNSLVHESTTLINDRIETYLRKN